MNTQDKINQAEFVGKSLAFPEITNFNELFSSTEPRKDYPFRGTSKISNWLLYSDHHSEHREPKDKVLSFIRETMLPVQYDSIYFHVIDRKDGTTLITAQYNQILGNRWLAFVDTDSINIR